MPLYFMYYKIKNYGLFLMILLNFWIEIYVSQKKCMLLKFKEIIVWIKKNIRSNRLLASAPY